MSASTSATRVVHYHHTCNTCGKAFQRKAGLERHQRSAHTHETPFACEFCIKRFSRTDLLQRHVSLYHKSMAKKPLQSSRIHKSQSITDDELFLQSRIEKPFNSSAVNRTNTDWPKPNPRHVQLYRIHFSQHISFIHSSFFDHLNREQDDELDADLRRGMAIIGGIYERAIQGGLDHGGRPLERSCVYYGQERLKRKVLRSIENLQDDIQPRSKRILVRRTQTMVLLQLAAMFSDSRKHCIGAKLTHGSLIAIARELLNELNRSSIATKKDSWMDFIEEEECIRTIWTVYFVDSLQSFCNQQKPWFNLSEFSNLPDWGSDALWNADSEDGFESLRSQSASSSDGEPIHIFDLISRLRNGPSMTLPKQLSLAGTFSILLFIVTEIAGLMKDDSVKRIQLASHIQRTSENGSSLNFQDIHAYDETLRKSLDDVNQRLSRWLCFAKSSSSSYSNKHERCKGSTFTSDFMPWYCAGVYFIHLLYKRISGGEGREDMDSFLQSLESQQVGRTQSDPLEIMHFLVRIRLALQDLDNNDALMRNLIEKEGFEQSLPPLPMSVAISSISGLFPLQSA